MKNKIFRCSILLSSLLLVMYWLPACKKEPNKTVIQGHITEYGTNTPIQGARIYLWCYGGEIFGPTGSSFVDSLVTDANGAFHAEFLDKDLCGGIYLSAYKEGYFYKNDLDIHSGVNDLEIVLDPEAWLRVVTVPDVGGNRIYFTGSFTGASGWETSITDGIREWFFLTRGGREHWIDWDYFGGGFNSHRESLILPSLDTTTFTIHY